MPVPMPAAIVLIVCKTVAVPFASEIDEANAKFTGYESRTWKIEHSMMQCRRIELQTYEVGDVGNPSAGVPPTPAQDNLPLNRHRCQMGALFAGVRWDEQHRSSSYRFWRAACPVPIVDTRTGEVIGWKIPECGHRDTVICEVDAEI